MSVMSGDQHSVAQQYLTRRNIQRDAGDGNSEWADEEFDNKSLYRDREDSNARTTFFHWDSNLSEGCNREKWKRLAEYNHGKGEDDQAPRKWEAGKVNDALLFCDHLEFDEQKSEKVVEMTEDIDFDQFGRFSTEQVQVAVCSLVADEQTQNFEDRIITRDEFKELMEVVSIGSKEHRTIRQAIRERTEYF